MLTLSWSTFRERWTLFLGAIASIAVGIALTQSALTVAASATPPSEPGRSQLETEQLRAAYDDVATVMYLTALLAIFLTIFIIATTFAFTVAQRRRDLALLRVLGAGTGQVRLLVVGEAVILAACGIALGIPLGIPMVEVQLALLRRADFLPAGFSVSWTSWAAIVAACCGLAVAVLGVLAASRRAARVRPLEALRDVSTVSRVMTASRWIVGLLLLGLSLALVLAAPAAGLVGALSMSLGIAVLGGVALSLLSPLVVPLVARLLGLALRRSTLGGIAEANLRHSVRRSASTAAPLIVLVALVVGLAGTLAAVSQATEIELRNTVTGDLVVETTGRDAAKVATVPGVATASPETSVPMLLRLEVTSGGVTEIETYSDGIVAVDPAAFRATHDLDPVSGDLDDLVGATFAAMQPADSEPLRIGQKGAAIIDDEEQSLRLVAVMPERLSTSQEILVPRDLIPASLLHPAATDVIVDVAPGADPMAVAGAIHRLDIGTVSTVADWAERQSDAQQRANDSTMMVLLGLSGLYALMALVNAVVMAGSERRREFAVARLTGLTRGQVTTMAALEAVAVTVIGLLLGGLVVAAALTGIALASREAIGTAVLAVPWTLVLAITAGAFGVVGLPSICTARWATRPRPVRLASVRE